MSKLATHSAHADVEATLRERCASLQLALVACDAQGRWETIAAGEGAQDAPLVRRWLAAPMLKAKVRGCAPVWAGEDIPEPVELYPGCWSTPLARNERRKRVGYYVVIALEPGAVSGEHYQAVCQSAQLDAEAMTRELAPLATHSRADAPRIARMLAWCLGDMEEIAASKEALDGLSLQLADSYEEISLLYTLGSSMKELVRPEKFVRLLTEQLHATLAYGWVAARLYGSASGDAKRPGSCILSGRPEADRDRVAAAIDLILTRVENDAAVVVESESDEQRAVFGDEALLQPILRDDARIGVLVAGAKRDDARVTSIDMKLLEAAAAYLTVLLDNAALYDDQRAMFLGTLEALSASIDAKDSYTCGHSQRVAHLSMRLAAAAEFDEAAVERLRVCGLVHDIGKIGVPEAVLRKREQLNDEEFEQIKLHPEIGHRILKDIPQLEDVLPAVLHHHERWDGKGYPAGLTGQAIPIEARIVGIADAFDAMSSSRTYRVAMARETVLSEIAKCAGSQFDPDLVRVFVELDFTDYDVMNEEHRRADQGDPYGAAA